MHLWCRTMLSSVRISGEWKSLWFGKEPNHWDRSGCPRCVTRGIRNPASFCWGQHAHGKGISQLVNAAEQSQCYTLDMLYKHCCPSSGDRKAFLPSRMVPSSIPGPFSSNTLGIFVSFTLKRKQVTFAPTGITGKLLRIWHYSFLLRISRTRPYSYAMMAAVRDNKWLDMKLPS